MLSNIIIVLKVFLIYGALGFGLHGLTCPNFIKKTPFSSIIMVVYGVLIVVIVNTIFFSFGFLLSTTFWLTIFVSLTLTVIYIILNFSFIKNFNKKYFLNFFSNKLKKNLFVLLVTCLASVVPLLILSKSSVLNIRLGVDITMYVKTANFLILNTKWNEYHGFAADCLFFHFRWGVPIILSFTQKILTNNLNVILNSYFILSAFFGILILMSSLLFFLFVKANLKQSLIGCLLVLFNVNFFFLLTEGQWPHLLSIIFFIFLIILCKESEYQKIRSEKIKIFISICLVFAFILSTISEILPLIFCISLMIVFFDILFKNWKRVYSVIIYFYLSFVLIFILLYKFTIFSQTHNEISLFNHIINLSISAAGYPLPRFSLPTEILGFSNIYYDWKSWFGITGNPLHEVKFSLSKRALNVVSSLLIIYYGFKGIGLMKTEKKILILPFFIISFFSYFYYFYYQKSSYIYTKIFTTFIPFFLIPFIYLLKQSYFNNTKKRYLSLKSIKSFRVVFVIFIFSSFISFVTYLNGFKQSSKSITINTVNFLNSIPFSTLGSDFFNSVIVFRPRGLNQLNLSLVDRDKDWILSSLMSLPVLDEWDLSTVGETIDYRIIKNSIIYLLLEKKEIVDFKNFKNKNIYNLILEDKEWIVYRTDLRVDEYVKMSGSGSMYILNKLK
jgi:hypothetical protein